MGELDMCPHKRTEILKAAIPNRWTLERTQMKYQTPHANWRVMTHPMIPGCGGSESTTQQLKNFVIKKWMIWWRWLLNGVLLWTLRDCAGCRQDVSGCCVSQTNGTGTFMERHLVLKYKVWRVYQAEEGCHGPFRQKYLMTIMLALKWCFLEEANWAGVRVTSSGVNRWNCICVMASGFVGTKVARSLTVHVAMLVVAFIRRMWEVSVSIWDGCLGGDGKTLVANCVFTKEEVRYLLEALRNGWRRMVQRMTDNCLSFAFWQ